MNQSALVFYLTILLWAAFMVPVSQTLCLPIQPLRARRTMRFKSGGSKARVLMEQGKYVVDSRFSPNNLRILGGMFGGRKIESPLPHLRPMMAKVRNAVFNSLQSMYVLPAESCRFLDCFSGSGSVGLEALSRGAQHVTFADLSSECIATCQRNVESFNMTSKSQFVTGNVFDILRDPGLFGITEAYDVISLTPPYEEITYSELISTLVDSPLLKHDCVVLIEYPIESGVFPAVIENRLIGLRNRRYGRTAIATYVYLPRRHFDVYTGDFLSFKKKQQRYAMRPPKIKMTVDPSLENEDQSIVEKDIIEDCDGKESEDQSDSDQCTTTASTDEFES